MDMEKTINIFGIEIDNKTAKESMKSAIAMMDSDGLSTIELITMDMLLKEQENQEMKEAVRRMDLVLPAYQLAMLANLVVGSLAAFLGGRTAGESAAQLLSYLGWRWTGLVFLLKLRRITNLFFNVV